MKWSLLTATKPHSGISPSFKVSDLLQKPIHFPSNSFSSGFCSKGSWLSPPPRGLWSPRFPLTPVVQFWRSGTSAVRSKNFLTVVHMQNIVFLVTSFLEACFIYQILNKQLVVDLPGIRCTAPSEQLCGETWSYSFDIFTKKWLCTGLDQ